MATEVKIEIQFSSASNGLRAFNATIAHPGEASYEGKSNLAQVMISELRKSVSFVDHLHALPDLGDLLHTKSPAVRPSDPMAGLDLFNVPSLWLEISNTFTDLRYVLAQAKAYKVLEPPNSNPVSNQLCAHLHYEKIYRLNLAAFQLVKIKDLVVRLLQEAFSGRLISVNYDKEGWEKDLTLSDAKEGLKAFLDRGELEDSEHRAILNALELTLGSHHREVVVRYRNRIAHGIRPSVDYAELFTNVQDRAGEIIRDASGKVIGRQYRILGGTPPPEFQFEELYTAMSGYMGHVAKMLKRLKQIPRLNFHAN
ncbi:MAG: hypothetical protein ACRD3P_09385 [Terriglobales bacterium]